MMPRRSAQSEEMSDNVVRRFVTHSDLAACGREVTDPVTGFYQAARWAHLIDRFGGVLSPLRDDLHGLPVLTAFRMEHAYIQLVSGDLGGDRG